MPENIYNYTEELLAQDLTSLGEPSYRARQIMKGLYSANLKKFSEFTTLPKVLRQKLETLYSLGNLQPITVIRSDDETTKFLWQLEDGKKIESVIIYEGERVTFCISSQVGCALDCKFCATGKMGIIRDLTAGEIIEQVLLMKEQSIRPPTNIVFMGMGEPFLNYDAVLQAADVLSDPEGLCFSRKRITISTSGIIKHIYRFTDERRPYSLAISLNAVSQKVRARIMPVSRKYTLDQLLEAVRYYTKNSGKRITFEYVLIDGLNTSEEDARKLVKITHDIPCKINIIPCNSDDPLYHPPAWETVEQFDRIVNESRRTITIRNRKGWDIRAACGQLYTAHQNA